MVSLSDLMDPGPFEDLLATYQLTPQWSCLACGTSWFGGPGHDCPAARKPDRAFEHLLMVKTMKAFRIRRAHDLGVTTGCA